MELLFSLWLAVVCAAGAVWIWGALSWTGIPIHARDFRLMPEGKDRRVMDFVREVDLEPGVYGFPNFVPHAEAQKPEIKALFDKGPMGTLSVWRKPSMGRNMLWTFVIELIASALIAYLLVAAGLPRGAEFAKVFQVAATAGVLTYSVAALPGMVWFQANRPAIVSALIDGVVMGLLTGAAFGLLWPS